MYEIFQYIAIPSTVVMLLFLVLSLIGHDGADSDMETHTDVDSDDGSGFPIFTLKNLTAFLTLFGWVGMACVSYGMNPFWTILIATISGIAFVAVLSLLFISLYKLEHSSTMSFQEGVGKEVIVYSRITKEVPGQITIILNSSLQTVQASSIKKTFQTGETVKVISATKMGFIVDSI